MSRETGTWTWLVSGTTGYIIQSPAGSNLRVQRYEHGAWQDPSPSDTKYFVEAANLLREKNIKET